MTEKELAALEPYKKYPCKNSMGETRRFVVEDDKTVFVYGKGRRRYGQRLSHRAFIMSFSVNAKDLEEKDPTTAWRKRMRRAVKCMEASGLWPEIKEVFDNILASGMTWEDRSYMSKLRHKDSQWVSDYRYDGTGWKADPVDQNEVLGYKSRFPFAFGVSDDGSEFIQTAYIYEMSECRLKAMYFGKWLNESEKAMIRDALEEKRSYRSAVQAGYDVSFSYNADENKAWYSEEYRGCGNGHYYLALDCKTALFCEDD